MREDDALMVATFLQLDGPVARGVWAPVAPAHLQIVRRGLEQGVSRIVSDRGARKGEAEARRR